MQEKIVAAICILILSYASGWLYHLGGCKEDHYDKLPPWLQRGYMRDVGCSLCGLAQLWLVTTFVFPCSITWVDVLIYAVIGLWGLRSYWDSLNDLTLAFRLMLLNMDKKDGYISAEEYLYNKVELEEFFGNKQWWNWLLVGLTMSSRWLVISHEWYVFVYVIANALLVMFFSLKYNDVKKEEMARGGLFIV
jgi:hypothetical protein